jgi:hypothetical protein
MWPSKKIGASLQARPATKHLELKPPLDAEHNTTRASNLHPHLAGFAHCKFLAQIARLPAVWQIDSSFLHHPHRIIATACITMATSEPSSSSSGFTPLKPLNPLGMHPVRPVRHARRAHPVTPSHATPPVAKNFSFSVSGLWKSNGNLLRWITEVPAKPDEAPFTPASYQSEKRSLVSNLWASISHFLVIASRGCPP